MKLMPVLFLCFFAACLSQPGSGNRASTPELTDQEASVETYVISRGRYQYVLVIEDGPHAGKYLPEEELPEQFCQDKLKVSIDGQILNRKEMVYKPGPTDIPEKDFEVPVIRVEDVKRKE